MSEINFHGWSRSDKDYSIHVGVIPGRKKPALYMAKKNGFYPLAFFKGTEEAQEAIKVLDELIGPIEREKQT